MNLQLVTVYKSIDSTRDYDRVKQVKYQCIAQPPRCQGTPHQVPRDRRLVHLSDLDLSAKSS